MPQTNPDALPQLIGEFRPVDEWQMHINQVFYGLRGSRLRDYYQTFAAADYRLAHALAADYFARVLERERKVKAEVKAKGGAQSEPQPQPRPQPALTVMEWGCGNGNLAACFLSHLKRMDTGGAVYPWLRYVLVDDREAALESARDHPDLAEHLPRVETLCATVADFGSVKDASVDRILCNELWNDLPTKLMLRKEGEVEEEYLRPNLSESKHAAISDWSGFVRAFDAKDLRALAGFPPFLEDIIWEKDYRRADWKAVPYRKTITEFLKQIDERVLVPVNLGACATLKEGRRILAPDAVGFSSFDAGTVELKVLNDPEKPLFGQFGGQYSFMVNFALVEAVAKHLGVQTVAIEPQKEMVGRSLGTNVVSLMDLLAAHPSATLLKPWERDKLILKTIHSLNTVYHSPYERPIEFPFRPDLPPEEREVLQGILKGLKRDGVPDTIAYLTEEELFGSVQDLQALGYDRQSIQVALASPPQPVDYYHLFFRP
jgi:SAM-dependent MidA family methyltransferase